jgi:hypothetical protein
MTVLPVCHSALISPRAVGAGRKDFFRHTVKTEMCCVHCWRGDGRAYAEIMGESNWHTVVEQYNTSLCALHMCERASSLAYQRESLPSIQSPENVHLSPPAADITHHHTLLSIPSSPIQNPMIPCPQLIKSMLESRNTRQRTNCSDAAQEPLTDLAGRCRS